MTSRHVLGHSCPDLQLAAGMNEVAAKATAVW
jgi:hypothetical protein